MSSELHEKQKYKNYAVLLAIVGFAAVIFVVTLIKMKGGG